MFRDPLVLDVLFILNIGKGLISVVTMSVVVPQAIGIFLPNTTASKRNALAFDATISDFKVLLLKIESFLANQIFHEINVGMACHIFLHA